jgi:hypothetical protein
VALISSTVVVLSTGRVIVLGLINLMYICIFSSNDIDREVVLGVEDDDLLPPPKDVIVMLQRCMYV